MREHSANWKICYKSKQSDDSHAIEATGAPGSVVVVLTNSAGKQEAENALTLLPDKPGFKATRTTPNWHQIYREMDARAPVLLDQTSILSQGLKRWANLRRHETSSDLARARMNRPHQLQSAQQTVKIWQSSLFTFPFQSTA